MNTRKLFPWLLGLMLMATTVPTFTACSDDDDDKGGNGTEQTDSLTAQYDDLAFFQEAMCTIDSAGKLVRYEIGEAIQENTPQHRYIGVDNIEEAAKIFANWIAPDVELGEITPNVTELTALLTDTLGHAQGTIYFRKGSDTSVAEVTASAGTNLKYIDRITFLLNSAWPYNSEALVWHKGDIRVFTITGKAGEELTDKDKELPFVLVREGKNGQNPMWVALTNDKYGFITTFGEELFNKIRTSDYCPAQAKAKEIASMVGGEWDFFKSKFDEAKALGGGELRGDGSYLINSMHRSGLFQWYYDMIWLSNGWIHGEVNAGEQFLLKVDWLKDGDIPLRATGGLEITDGSFEDSRGSYHNLFDGMSNTRWCVNHQFWASQSNPLYWVEFESDSPIMPTGYIFVTADVDRWPQTSCDSRPHNWKLYGKRRLRNDWTLLDQRSGEGLPSESYKEKRYNFSNGGGEYQYFRLEITDNQPWLCLADFKFTF